MDARKLMGAGLLPVLLVLAGCGDSGKRMLETAFGERPAAQEQSPEAAMDGADRSGETRPPPAPAAGAGVPVAASPGDEATPASPGAPATRAFEFDTADPAAAAPATCGFPDLAQSGPFRLYAAGAYSGRDLGYAIDRSGHEATTVDVLVNSPAVPVALMLGNYEPTVWNIGWTEGTRIVAVLVGGYHSQVVTGLPASVPRLVSTHENRGPCGYFYVSEERSAGLNPLARQVFGRPVDLLHPARDGKVVIGGAVAPGARLLTDAAARPASAFRLPDSLAGGAAGLQYAVAQGWLRPATQADAQAWKVAYDARAGADLPPVAGGRTPSRMTVHNGYVVLKSFELPPGLYGAHSATFFVPKGVQRPTGNPGHSAIYDFNTLTCQGAVCGMGD
ncbi:hypothetical protein [Pseudoxanthomonas sp. 10H]|uniref:hypothetical protein n=1 Tax=Pseudoxanthomonas sp. 10H TaxID=3242729 RepID=UPI0035566946